MTSKKDYCFTPRVMCCRFVVGHFAVKAAGKRIRSISIGLIILQINIIINTRSIVVFFHFADSWERPKVQYVRTPCCQFFCPNLWHSGPVRQREEGLRETIMETPSLKCTRLWTELYNYDTNIKNYSVHLEPLPALLWKPASSLFFPYLVTNNRESYHT